MPSMASTPSPRRPTPSPNEEGEESLKSKRSSIAIKCSDGSKVIFFRPHRPRSGSYAAVSHSPSPSPSPPPGPGPGPTCGPGQGAEAPPSPPNSEHNKKPRPHSLPAQLNVYGSHADVGIGQSHRSLPAYLSKRCTECGHHRGHSEACTVGNRPFIPAPLGPMPARADEEAHDNSIEHQRSQPERGPRDQGGTRTPRPQPGDSNRQTRSDTPRPPASIHGETGRGTPRPGRSSTSNSSSSHHSHSHSQRAPSRNRHTPSPRQGIGSQHNHRTPSPPSPPPPHRVPSRNSPSPHNSSDQDSDHHLSSRARYSIQAVVGGRRSSSPVSSSRSHHPQSSSPSSRRSGHRCSGCCDNKFRLEVREISAGEARSRSHSASPLYYFDANIRGGYGSGSGSGSYQAAGGDGSSRDRDRDSGRCESRGGTGRSRRRSRDVLLRGLRRCFVFLFGNPNNSSRREAYDYGQHERPLSRCRSRRTRRH
ncbi:hypothetical protein F5B21DRAFT_491636 [Xylaria acuta]|nr:hypothetical protein F5B21DRAFT_491636 [Xylaria acuta]